MTSSPPAAFQPYLSVVVTTRNDDHGGNPLGRTQAFINGLVGQCRRHQLPAELIIVEWNPPPDRPPLEDVLEWPEDREFCKVRIIEVPPELHQRIPHWQALPLYQMIGKNVGIRRAQGEYVLATNIDILFSDELMSFIAARRLEPGKMYRVNRWDVEADVPVSAPVEEQLAYCKSHLIRLNAREGTFRLDSDGSRAVEENDILTPGGPIKLGANWFARERSGEEPFRWVDNDAELIIGPVCGKRILELDVEPGPGVNMGPFALELRDASGQRLSAVRVRRRSIITFTLPYSGEESVPVYLHALDGGRRIGTDIRTLNFRLFRCALEDAAGASAAKNATVAMGAGVPAPPKEVVYANVRTAESLRSRIGRGLKLAREIWRSNPDVQIRLPMSSGRLAKLQLRQDGNGVSFSAGAFQPGGRGERQERILPEGMRAIFGSGWYPLEHFGGETFRWMQERAEIIWLAPRNAPPAFFLTVEPGPAVGHKSCELIIRNQWGAEISRHSVKGRSEIRIPIAHSNGPLVTTFEALSSGPPKIVRGESRILALRVCGSRWESTGEPATELIPGDLIASGSNIWYANGWNMSRPEDGGGIAAMPGAELILRAPETDRRSLSLEVTSDLCEPVELVIEDTFGHELFRGAVEDSRLVSIEMPFLSGRYYALRLRYGNHEQNEAGLTLAAISWAPPGEPQPGKIPAADRLWIPTHQPPSDQAVWLHTNACGDFTLIAREHWIDLRAYPELDLFSMNIDSVFCWMAHHGGAREEMLEDPMRIYHIEHGAGSGWTPEGEKTLFERIAAKGLSWVDYHEVIEWARIMNRYDAPMIFNRSDWGFGGDQLKETTPRTRAAMG